MHHSSTRDNNLPCHVVYDIAFLEVVRGESLNVVQKLVGQEVNIGDLLSKSVGSWCGRLVKLEIFWF